MNKGKINEDKENEILHWLAYNFPGVYRIWTDKENNNQLINESLNKFRRRFK